MNGSSLRWKFTSAIATGTVMATILSAVGFSWRDWNRFWERTSAEVSTLASIMASQLGAAIVLHDDRAASEILGSLRTDRRISHATVYTAANQCFVVYARNGSGTCAPRPHDGMVVQANRLIVTRPVTAGEERIGAISIAATVPGIEQVVGEYIAGTILVVVLSLVLSAALAFVLQARVTAPILVIASAAREMARTHQFGKRVPISSADEIGALAFSFNLMLQQLEERDNELAAHREQLECEIAERTRVNAELQQAKERAESAARIKAEFLANMSHEIRTPLNGVSGMINLAYGACDDAGVREQLGYARTAAQSLITIVNDILDFSKIEAGKMTVESVDFDLRRTLDECRQLFELTARGKNLELEFAIDGDCPDWVLGDPVRLRQVLVNLIGNAVKFTAEGSVRVRVAPAGTGSIRFEVSDTGIGIPAQKLKTIFEPFTQADGSHTRRFGGSGLGLAITLRLVTLMGGKLWAESEPGRGSRFFLELPLPAGSEEKPGDAPTSQPNLPRIRVLVAEDNLVNQKVISGILQRQHWPVTVVGDGRMAFRAFEEQSFDLILMDVQMPEVDGLEATRMIREEERRRSLTRTPILALTAHASQSQHAICLEQGMDGVVVKPIDVRDLFERIGRVLHPECPSSQST